MLPVRIQSECNGFRGHHMGSAHYLREREPLKERALDSLFCLNLLPSPSQAKLFPDANPRKAPPSARGRGRKPARRGGAQSEQHPVSLPHQPKWLPINLLEVKNDGLFHPNIGLFFIDEGKYGNMIPVLLHYSD